jgi:hydroxymethylbilane synthase
VLVEIETTGDRIRDQPLSQIGGDGLFTKEIQRALLAGAVDVAVHSLKDLPTHFVEGITLAAVPERGPVGDAFVTDRHKCFDELPPGATVGTSSLRRRSQALHRRPDLKLVNLRGNVESRIHKLENNGLDAIVLAQAGLERLGLQGRITEILDSAWMLPAVGQGALGLECRSNDTSSLSLVHLLDHYMTRAAVLAERALLRGLGGGCLVPIGALAEIRGDQLSLQSAVLRPDGSGRVGGQRSGPASLPEEIGRCLAEDLLLRGAKALLCP